jgi:superfamily I DNA/RNA helicase
MGSPSSGQRRDLKAIEKVSPRSFQVRSFHNFTKEFINPDLRARQYVEDLREQLAARPELSDARGRLSVEVRYFVAFPNIRRQEFTEASLDKVMAEDHVLLRDDLKDEKIFAYRFYLEYKKLPNRLTREKWNAVRLALFPELKIPGSEQWFASPAPAKGPIILESEAASEFGLDLAQEQVAKSLGDGPRFLHGIAGTGKTLILLYHAKLYSANGLASGQPRKILVLCWNISLAQYMRQAYGSMQVPNAGEVEIIHFSEFARCLVQAAGLRFPASKSRDFDAHLTDTLNKLEIPSEGVYDMIYVDEAQDFQKEWIEFIFNKLLRGKPSRRNLVIAGDDAQHIYRNRDFSNAQGFTWKSIGIPMVGRTKILKKIYRNSARVFSFALAFNNTIGDYYDGRNKAKIEFAPKRGFDPQLIHCPDLGCQVARTVELIQRLKDDGYSPRNAMVLYRWANVRGAPLLQPLLSRLDEVKILSGSPKTIPRRLPSSGPKRASRSPPCIPRGMDAPAVILIGAETFLSKDSASLDDEEKLMYVALTRAREILTVLYTHEDGLVPRLQSAMELYKKYRKRILAAENQANRELFR